MDGDGYSRRYRRRANAERNWQVILRAAFIGAYCLVLLAAGIYLGYKGREVPEPAPPALLEGPMTGESLGVQDPSMPTTSPAESEDPAQSQTPAQSQDPTEPATPPTQSETPAQHDAPDSTNTPAGTAEDEPATTVPESPDSVTESPGIAAELPEPTAALEVTAPAEVLEWPVPGEVIGEVGWFFSEEMDEWRYLSGVDIRTTPGETVAAAMSGTVTSVRSDPVLGTVVTIEHQGGRATEYGRLSGCTLGVGDRVKQGEAIARADGATVYFGTSVDGEAVSVLECMKR